MKQSLLRYGPSAAIVLALFGSGACATTHIQTERVVPGPSYHHAAANPAEMSYFAQAGNTDTDDKTNQSDLCCSGLEISGELRSQGKEERALLRPASDAVSIEGAVNPKAEKGGAEGEPQDEKRRYIAGGSMPGPEAGASDKKVENREPEKDREDEPSGEEKIDEKDDEKTDEKTGGRGSIGDDTGAEYLETGVASWYGKKFDGRPTASGEIFDSRKLTAAHRKLPLGTIIVVRNLDNDREVVLRVNDRGPFVRGRVLDISEYGAERLAFKDRGLTRVGIKIVRRGNLQARGPGLTRAYYGPEGKEHETDKPSPDVVAGGDDSYFSGGGRGETIIAEKSTGVGGDDKNEDDTLTEPSRAGEQPRTREMSARPKTESDDRASRSGETVPKITRTGERSYDEEGSNDGFSVQIGLFESEINAVKMKNKLRETMREPVFIVKRGMMFVVKAGVFNAREDAETLRDRLQAEGMNAFVTRNRD